MTVSSDASFGNACKCFCLVFMAQRQLLNVILMENGERAQICAPKSSRVWMTFNIFVDDADFLSSWILDNCHHAGASATLLVAGEIEQTGE